MTIVHRLIGYDNITELLVIEHDIPASKLKHAKELVRIPHEDIDAIGSYQLDGSQARDIAMPVFKRINVDRYLWFLEPFDESDVEDTAA